MAKTSTLTVKLDGTPLVGAEVLSSVDTEAKTTDGDGKISGSFPDNYATVAFAAICHSSIPNIINVSLWVLKAGEDYVIDIPSTIGEGGGNGFYGIRSHFIRES